MNVKDLARQALRDACSQDNEGGPQDAMSFIMGYVQGFSEGELKLVETELKFDELQTALNITLENIKRYSEMIMYDTRIINEMEDKLVKAEETVSLVEYSMQTHIANALEIEKNSIYP